MPLNLTTFKKSLKKAFSQIESTQTDALKQFSDCFEKVDGKEQKNIFSPEEEKLAADLLKATRQRY